MKKRMIIYLVTILVFGTLVFFVYDHFKDVKKKDLKDDYFLNTEIERGKVFNTLFSNKKVYVVIDQIEYVLDFERTEAIEELLSLEDYSLSMSINEKNQLVGYLNSPITYNTTYNGYFYKGDVLLSDSNCIKILLDDIVTNDYYAKIGHIEGLKNIENKQLNVSFIIG